MSCEMEKMEFYLVTTAHLADGLWFRDDEDFRAGMNTVAVIAYLTGIRVLAFILMSNHVHFVLCGTREQVAMFANEYKRHHSAYLQIKYGCKEFLRRNDVDIKKVCREDESFERAIAYVQMNSVAANICLHPTGYRWGTGNSFFKETNVQGQVLGSMSIRAQKRLLRSHIMLPQDYLTADGYVLTESYVQVQFVESVFRSPARLNYFLVNSSKAKRKLESESASLPVFRDQSILAAVPDLCYSLFRQSDLMELKWEQQAEVIKQIKRRFGSDIHQIARVTGVPYAEAAKMLDSF